MDSWKAGWILVASHIVVERGGGIFLKEEVDSGSVTLYKTGYILGGRGRL